MKTSFLKLMPFVLLLLLSACEKEPEEGPLPENPQQHLPNPLPGYALVKQVEWNDIDIDFFTYNAKGQVSQLKSQRQYVIGDPTQVRTLIYDFQYDAQNKPVRVDLTGGWKQEYEYTGDRIAKTREMYSNGTLAKEVTFSYNRDRISEEHWRVVNYPLEPDDFYKAVFSYDSKGNVNKVETFKQDSLSQYELMETIEYSDFDDKINPTSWTMRFPYLPQIRWQFNNPRKEVRTPALGVPTTTTFEYQYNSKGMPVNKKITRSVGDTYSVDYQY